VAEILRNIAPTILCHSATIWSVQKKAVPLQRISDRSRFFLSFFEKYFDSLETRSQHIVGTVPADSARQSFAECIPNVVCACGGVAV
jgi:hypothetical protein